uniref:Uncharacterized protein n=1 Tax=viral metagenome TaxID=1070528 RepID=A0A6M3LKC6_9ZZZZ
MKSKLIHHPYRSYNREEDKWQWTVEVHYQELRKYTFDSREEAEEFKEKDKR